MLFLVRRRERLRNRLKVTRTFIVRKRLRTRNLPKIRYVRWDVVKKYPLLLDRRIRCVNLGILPLKSRRKSPVRYRPSLAIGIAIFRRLTVNQ